MFFYESNSELNTTWYTEVWWRETHSIKSKSPFQFVMVGATG